MVQCHKNYEEYIDIYQGIQLEIVSSNSFDGNSDLSTTYLGSVDKECKNKLKAEESFPISEHGYTSGRLLDGTKCQLLLDMAVSKSFILHVMQITLCQNVSQGLKGYK